MSISPKRIFNRLRPAVIIDHGTTITKYAFCKDPLNVSQTYTLFKVPRDIVSMEHWELAENAVHAENLTVDEDIKLISPLEKKVITNAPLISKLWNIMFFNILKIAPSRRPILLLLSIRTSAYIQLELITHLFEDFDFATVGILYNELANLFATNKSTGVIVDLGDGGISIVPFYNGFVVKHAIWYLPITGFNLDEYFCKLLNEKGYSFNCKRDLSEIRKIRETYVYVTPNPDKEAKLYDILGPKLEKIAYASKDREIKLGRERYLAGEIFFNPSLMNISSVPLDEAIIESIESCLVSTRPELYKNIILTGGLARIKGIADRIAEEIKRKKGVSDVSIITPRDPYVISITGGFMACRKREFLEYWILREEFEKNKTRVLEKIDKLSLFE